MAAQHYLRNEPTPFFTADAWTINCASGEGAATSTAIQPNDIEAIPGYELLGILGRGGMGIVFRARQLSLKRQVALKMILSGRHARPTERARFQREAEAVARLQHPNIVQIYEVGEQNGLPYFSLEFVNAGSLAQFLGGNPQPPRLSAQFILNLARAMHYAHKRGIVHRDLKPANILLQLDESQILKNGQMADTAIFRDLTSYVPKITDFGLAKHMGGEEGPPRHGAMVGTPSYMAPEQAHNSGEEIGPAADVYALGTILYEMLTGRPPFIATTVDETAQQVLTQEPVPPTQLQPKIPRDLETICLVCLQKKPGHRYSSAETLAEDLRRFLANEPIYARRTHLPERVVKWATRRPWSACIGLFAFATISLLWWIWVQRAKTYQAEREEMFHAWQQSEGELSRAMSTIDQMAAELPPHDAAPASPQQLQQAKEFYERLAQQEGPLLRTALAYHRLAKIQQRLGEHQGAKDSYQKAIARWEHLAEKCPNSPEYRDHLRDSQQSLRTLAANAP